MTQSRGGGLTGALGAWLRDLSLSQVASWWTPALIALAVAVPLGEFAFAHAFGDPAEVTEAGAALNGVVSQALGTVLFFVLLRALVRRAVPWRIPLVVIAGFVEALLVTALFYDPAADRPPDVALFQAAAEVVVVVVTWVSVVSSELLGRGDHG